MLVITANYEPVTIINIYTKNNSPLKKAGRANEIHNRVQYLGLASSCLQLPLKEVSKECYMLKFIVISILKYQRTTPGH